MSTSQEEYQLLIQEPDPTTLLYNNNEGVTGGRDNIINNIKKTIENQRKKINAFLLPKPKDRDLLKDKSDEFYQEVISFFFIYILKNILYDKYSISIIIFKHYIFSCYIFIYLKPIL